MTNTIGNSNSGKNRRQARQGRIARYDILAAAAVGLALTAGVAQANPASDRAFGSCLSAAASWLEPRGQQIGSVTMLTRDSNLHRVQIAAATAAGEPTTIMCLADGKTTSIEAVPSRIAVTSAAR